MCIRDRLYTAVQNIASSVCVCVWACAWCLQLPLASSSQLQTLVSHIITFLVFKISFQANFLQWNHASGSLFSECVHSSSLSYDLYIHSIYLFSYALLRTSSFVALSHHVIFFILFQQYILKLLSYFFFIFLSLHVFWLDVYKRQL